MTLASVSTSNPAGPAMAELPDLATSLADDFALRAARHDAEGSFVTENYDRLKEAGLIAAGVPAELGGGGASVAELGDMLRRLAHGCGSTALAFAMHTHQVAIPAWRWHNQPAVRPMIEPLLRRVAAERIILMSSGGADWVGGAGRAERVEGGYRITARKSFASGTPVGTMLMTTAVADDDPAGPTVLHFGAPLSAEGVKVHEVWDALGMRGTGSQDVMLDGLFIPDDRVALKRKAGEWHPLFQIIGTIAIPLIYSVYTGLAEALSSRALKVEAALPEARRNLRLAGEMQTRLCATQLAHRMMIDTAMTAKPSADSINSVMTGRVLVEENALATASLALNLAGGTGFLRATGIERMFRDIQGARFHPMRTDRQQVYAGAMALGQDVSRIY